MTIKKPMLAVAGDDHAALKYPRLASKKLDGVRALTHPSLGLVSRAFKPIRNDYVRAQLNYTECQNLDGELITYNGDGTRRTFGETMGDVMRKEGMPCFIFHVFDDFTNPGLPFSQRYLHLFDRVSVGLPFVNYVKHEMVGTPEELERLRDRWLDKGYEGLMTRDPSGPYKQGRSTVTQGWLLKHKRWHDSEALVISVEEQMHNENQQERGATGESKRSSAKAGLVPAGTMGALLVKHPQYGEFRIGTGFDAALRTLIWQNRGTYVGQHAKFKCQLEGAKDKPRFPVFLGFRHADDM